jgi:hypothetical protein
VLLFSETNGSLELVGTIALDRDSASPLKSLRDAVMSSSVFHEFAKHEL